MKKEQFGAMPDGTAVDAYTLTHKNTSATILTLGGILQKLVIDGCDIVAGYDMVSGYLDSDGYLGALIGRYANRIRAGHFTMNGKDYQLAKNEKNRTHLHGGNIGFDKRIWNAQEKPVENGEALVLSYASPDGEENYPGTVKVQVTYTLDDDGLSIRYEAQSDKDTPFNMTNHSYFNIDGYDSGDVMGQCLQLHADRYSTVDAQMIPVGTRVVGGTPFDFNTAKPIGRDIGADDEQLKLGCGYDHNFFIRKDAPLSYDGKTLYEAASVTGKTHKITAYTDMPCIQIYTANFMGGDIPLKGNVPKLDRHAVCLETQFEPDGPNRGEAILRAGEAYDYTTLFSVASAGKD